MFYVGSDHAGFDLKQDILRYSKENNIEFLDVGIFKNEICDYPDIAKEVCKRLIFEGIYKKAILICGTGVGMSIAANRFEKIRAVCASDVYSVRFSRLHNDSNVLCVGARVVGIGTALELVSTFLNTEFEGGRHKSRIEKLKI